MRYTNKHYLPEEIVKCIVEDDYDGPTTSHKIISATQLISPTKICLLKSRHSDELEEDVSDNIWRLFGKSIHYILSQQKTTDAMVEERTEVILNDVTISAKPDYYNIKERHLRDFKVTSVWSYLFATKGKKEWIEQLNVYAWVLRKQGMGVQRATITLILRDWNVRETYKNPDYPLIPIVEIDVELWPYEDQEKFIAKKLHALKHYRYTDDDGIPECTPEERWVKTTWALIKKGAKKATKVFKTEEERDEYIANAHWKPEVWFEGSGEYNIVERIGEDKRCGKYCNVNEYCHYWREKENEK